MDQQPYQQSASRISVLDPPIMTLVVYGGLIVVSQVGDLGSPIGRLLLIPGLLGLLIVPIVTSRALGHALLSAVGGGKVLRFTSGPLLLRRVDDRLKPGLNTRWSRYAGNVVTVAAPGNDLRRWVRWREVGPVIGMTFYVILVQVIARGLHSTERVSTDAELARMVETISFGLSVLVITLGVWQLVHRHVPRIWRMFRGGREADREAAIIGMTALMMVGTRPRDWPHTWATQATWDEDESIEGLYGYRFAYLHALDSGDLEAADHAFEHLAAHADRLPSRMREQIVDLERPFVEAWIRDDAAEARERLDELKKTVVERYRYRRIQAAVLLAEGEMQTARELAIEGLNTAAMKDNDGEVLAEVAILEEILERAGGDIDVSPNAADEQVRAEAESPGEASSPGQ